MNEEFRELRERPSGLSGPNGHKVRIVSDKSRCEGLELCEVTTGSRSQADLQSETSKRGPCLSAPKLKPSPPATIGAPPSRERSRTQEPRFPKQTPRFATPSLAASA